MDVVAAILALIAVVLLYLLLVTRRKAAAERTRSRAEVASFDRRLNEAQAAQTRAEAAASEAVEAARASQAESDERVEEAARVSSEAEKRATEAQQALDERVEKIASLERYSVDLQGQLSTVTRNLDTQREETNSLRESLAAAAARSASEAEGMLPGGIDPELLWALELIRSERTWRHSVAVDPSAPSPFPDAPDPLKFAVEVEASAMREEVGSFITLDWRAEAVSNPVRRLLILRVANELLAAAAREPQPFEMVATGSDEIEIHLRASEEGDRQLQLDPPRFGTDVIAFHADDEGVRVTIR